MNSEIFEPKNSSSSNEEDESKNKPSSEKDILESSNSSDSTLSHYKIYPNVGLNIYCQNQLVRAVQERSKHNGKYQAFNTSAWRSHAGVKDKVFVKLADLKSRFANFSDVIYMIESELRLACLSDKPYISIYPKLLLGPPGVGKTRFCFELAKVLGIPFYSKSIATMTASFILTGMSESWSDAKEGFIAKTLLNCAVSNPLIMLDEIDKSNADSRYDTTKPLLNLFEKHSAQRFEDEYYEIEFNASAINFITTANDERCIPEPILSRLEIFEIKIPDRYQSQAIVKSVFKEMLSEHDWGKFFKETLKKEVVLFLSELPPRTVRKKLLSACANAAKQQGTAIELSLSDFGIDKKPKKNSGIGFMANY
jgi:ATP-dependent Lon protease